MFIHIYGPKWCTHTHTRVHQYQEGKVLLTRPPLCFVIIELSSG